LKFNKLRLLGFKSFVEPTEFSIEGGLTGVVGPNGCGKSNLVEALRWVMGENSYKNMRASGMDDVIFSGSGNRPARNMAEVSLFLDNTNRTAPAAFNDADELQVSRRIERENGSVYRINGKDVRAKDVQLLFADASTGARSPSMVGQGRIGELISAKPQARRALLEEAAGVSGLHSRRHEAELRLRAAETNLDRLDDVIGQLDSQMETLRRQARQAKRYRALQEEIRKSEALLFHLRWTSFRESEQDAQQAMHDVTNLVAERTTQQSQAARLEAIASHKLPQLRDTQIKAAATVQRLTSARDQLDGERKRLETRLGELEQRRQQLDEDIASAKGLVEDQNKSLFDLDEEEANLQRERQSTGETEAATREALEAASQRLQESEESFTLLTARIAGERAKREQLGRMVEELGSRNQKLSSGLDEAKTELGETQKRMQSADGPRVARETITHAQAQRDAAESAALAAEISLGEAQQAEQIARKPLQEAETHRRELDAEARTLRKILNQDGQELFAAVVEQTQVQKGYERALGAALGEDLNQSVDANAATHWGGSQIKAEDPRLPNGVVALGELVSAPDELARRLAQIGVVQSDDEAEPLRKLLHPGQRLVSKQGTLWRWDGYYQSADAPTAAAQKLEQKNRLEELKHEIEAADAVVTNTKQALEHARQNAQERVSKDQSARSALREAEGFVREAQEKLAQAERANSELLARQNGLQETVERLSVELEDNSVKLQHTRAEHATLPQAQADESALETLRIRVAEDRAAAAEARSQFQTLAREAETRGRRLENIKMERNNWKTRIQTAAKQVDSFNKRRDAVIAELQELADLPSTHGEKRRKLSGELEIAVQEQSKASDLLAQGECDYSQASEVAKLALAALSEAREKSGRAEERLDAARGRLQEIEAQIRGELGCGPGETLARAGMEVDASLPELSQMEAKLERQKIDRERLGAVNLVAEEQQNETAEKRDAIVVERDDLIAAIAKLRSGIQSLNKEGRERLLEAFDVVNHEFTRLFTHLFGGGTAELQLVESDDPLEAGLEILARPPGKKPQTMTLLSGGEQALTAMALIFAVFLTNPAPICVLDEVDAPLDDHNVERFCNLMDDMAASTDTKFILITHNPITMARMNRMFGVTMAERGVSQLVSVNLEQAEQLRDTA